MSRMTFTIIYTGRYCLGRRLFDALHPHANGKAVTPVIGAKQMSHMVKTKHFKMSLTLFVAGGFNWYAIIDWQYDRCTTSLTKHQSHKPQNASLPYPTMPHSEQQSAYFCSEWCIVWYGTGALRDLWIRSSSPHNQAANMAVFEYQCV